MERTPFLLPFARPMEASVAIPGRYDASRGLRVVEDARGATPVISTRNARAFAVTKSDAQPERDDEDKNASFVDLITKTGAPRERDDDDAFSLANLVTKTEGQRERDDDDIVLLGVTKTLRGHEKDDEE